MNKGKGSSAWSLHDAVSLALSILGVLLAIVALVFSVTIPERIDHQAWDRQQRANCRESMLSLRSSMDTLANRYARASTKKLSPGSSWNAPESAIEAMEVDCTGQISDKLTARAKVLRQLFYSARDEAEVGRWDGVNASEFHDFTTDAITELTSREKPTGILDKFGF